MPLRNGSNDYRTSILKDQSISKIHVQACTENEIQKRKKRGEKYAPKPKKITITKSSFLAQGLNQMKEGEENCLSYWTERKAV